MKELTVKVDKDKVIVDYWGLFDGETFEYNSFRSIFDLNEYKNKIKKLKDNESIIIDGKGGKILIYQKKDKFYVSLIQHASQIEIICEEIPEDFFI